MGEEHRQPGQRDRRARARGGRRAGDLQKPWYMKRRLWVAAASLVVVGWRRVKTLGRKQEA